MSAHRKTKRQPAVSETDERQESDVATQAPDPDFDASALGDCWELSERLLHAARKSDEDARCELAKKAQLAETLQGLHQKFEQTRMQIAETQAAHDAADRCAASHQADAAAARRRAATHAGIVDRLTAEHGVPHPRDTAAPELEMETSAYRLPQNGTPPNGTPPVGQQPGRLVANGKRGTQEMPALPPSAPSAPTTGQP